MFEIGEFSYLLDSLNRFSDYPIERRLVREINNLGLNIDQSICYFKGLFLKEINSTLFIFTSSKIIKIKVNENNSELIECEIYSKSDINYVKYTTDYDKDYTLEFKLNGNIEVLNSTKDTNYNYKDDYNKIIKELIKYFNN